MRKPSAKDRAKIKRLRARVERLLNRGHAVEMRSRELYAEAEDVDRELADLERSLGLRKPIGPVGDLAKVACIFKKLYEKRLVVQVARADALTGLQR